MKQLTIHRANLVSISIGNFYYHLCHGLKIVDISDTSITAVQAERQQLTHGATGQRQRSSALRQGSCHLLSLARKVPVLYRHLPGSLVYQIDHAGTSRLTTSSRHGSLFSPFPSFNSLSAPNSICCLTALETQAALAQGLPIVKSCSPATYN